MMKVNALALAALIGSAPIGALRQLHIDQIAEFFDDAGLEPPLPLPRDAFYFLSRRAQRNTMAMMKGTSAATPFDNLLMHRLRVRDLH